MGKLNEVIHETTNTLQEKELSLIKGKLFEGRITILAADNGGFNLLVDGGNFAFSNKEELLAGLSEYLCNVTEIHDYLFSGGINEKREK